MTFCKQFAFTLFITISIHTAGSHAEAQQLLRWKFAEGDRFDIKVIQKTETTTKIGDKSLSLMMQTAMWIQWETVAVDGDGHATISHRFTRLATKTVTPDGKPSLFDTDRDDLRTEGSNAASRAVRPLLNSRAMIRMAPWGEIKKVEITAQTESLLGDIPALSQIKKLLTTEGINQTLRQSFGVFPAEELELGDTWAAKATIKSPNGPIQLSSQYTFDGPATVNGVEIHKVTSITKIQLPAENQDQSSRQNQPLTQNGMYWFDAGRGHLARSRLEQSIESDTPISGDQTIHVDANSTSVLEIVRH